MMVNYDCIRDTLKALATNIVMQNGVILRVAFPEIKEYQELKEYSEDDIIYSLKQLSQGNYIEAEFYNRSASQFSGVCVYDVTSNGHDLLKDISSDSIWHSAKEKASKAVGEVSLAGLREIAVQLVKSAIAAILL